MERLREILKNRRVAAKIEADVYYNSEVCSSEQEFQLVCKKIDQLRERGNVVEVVFESEHFLFLGSEKQVCEDAATWDLDRK